ncbi:MAG: hypothetical protein LBR34_02280 [Prevotella sp.]|jgi:hypothetical protein|nr:hypothetical protein [Prevotella sp.]
MKRRFFIWLLAACSLAAKSQDYAMPAMQGLQDKKGNIALEVSGYEITISVMKGKINDPKLLKSIKKKYGMQQVAAEFSETSLDIENRVIESETALQNDSAMLLNRICYVLEKTAKNVTVIFFQTLNQRDVVLEKLIVEMYLKNEISACILPSNVAKSIVFAGDSLQLGNACYWKSPHNLYYDGGQVSWSEFSSYESALLDINNCIRANSAQANILQEEEIDVLFWGIPSTAYRVVYMPDTGYYPLIVYYVVQMINGHYVSCLLSNYGYNRNDYELATLLRQFMDIPRLPETAQSPFDYPAREERPVDKEREWFYAFEIKAGTMLPVGLMRNNFSTAPFAGFSINWPTSNAISIGLGIQFAFPVNAQRFSFYSKGDEYSVKAPAMINVGLNLKHNKTVTQNVFLRPSIGLGFSSLSTNQKDEAASSDNETVYYSVETFYLTGGCALQYKKFGVFAEYQYAPYSIAGKVREHFGNSLVNVGLTFSF